MSQLTVTVAADLPVEDLKEGLEKFSRWLQQRAPGASVQVHDRLGPVIRVDVTAGLLFFDGALAPISRPAHRLLVALYQTIDPVPWQEIARAAGITFDRRPVVELVKRARADLGDLALIETVRGYGYRLNRAYTYIEAGADQ